MDQNDIQALVRTYLRKLRGSRPEVYFHWEIIFTGFLVFSLAMIIFNLYLFLEINKGEIFLVEQNGSVQVETIDRAVLKEVLASFDVQEAVFKERGEAPPSIPDPSR